MRFTNLVVAAAGFVAARAALELTDTTYAGIAVGKAFNITYSGASGSVTLILQNGPATNLKDVETIKSGLPSGTGSFVWTPESDLAADTYAIKIEDSVTSNYGALFQLVDATASPSSASASSTSVSATTTSSGSTTTSTGSTTSSAASSSSSSSSSSASSTSGSTSSSSSSTPSKTSSTSPSKTSSTTAASSTTSAPGGNSASGLASPLALVLLAFAAVLSFN